MAFPRTLGDDANPETEKRLDVARHFPVAGHDEELAELLGDAAFDLQDVLIEGVRGSGGALEEAPLLHSGHVERDLAQIVALGNRQGAGGDGDVPASARCDLTGRLRGPFHGLPIELLDVGVARGVPFLHAHPEAHSHAARSALQDAFVEDQSPRRAVFEEEIGVVAPSLQCHGEEPLGDLWVNRTLATGGEGGLVKRGFGSHGRKNVERREVPVECGTRSRAHLPAPARLVSLPLRKNLRAEVCNCV